MAPTRAPRRKDANAQTAKPNASAKGIPIACVLLGARLPPVFHLGVLAALTATPSASVRAAQQQLAQASVRLPSVPPPVALAAPIAIPSASVKAARPLSVRTNAPRRVACLPAVRAVLIAEPNALAKVTLKLLAIQGAAPQRLVPPRTAPIARIAQRNACVRAILLPTARYDVRQLRVPTRAVPDARIARLPATAWVEMSLAASRGAPLSFALVGTATDV